MSKAKVFLSLAFQEGFLHHLAESHQWLAYVASQDDLLEYVNSMNNILHTFILPHLLHASVLDAASKAILKDFGCPPSLSKETRGLESIRTVVHIITLYANALAQVESTCGNRAVNDSLIQTH